MSTREQLSRDVRVTAMPVSRWERTPQGDLCAMWRPGYRVTRLADSSDLNSRPARRLTRQEPGLPATARLPLINRWISGGFIASLYLLIVFAEIAVVVRA